jgi:hypothetical protein
MDNTADVTFTGEGTDNYFGISVSGAGDVNDDGYDDVIVGAYETGRAYIYLGATGTTMDNTADVEMIGEIVDGTRNDFGWSVSGAGDVNNDGYADVIVGAYRYNSYTGRAYIYYGGSSMDNAADVTFTGEGTDNDFGWSVSGAGDVNGDNFDDVIVGADGYNSETGRAYIYYGATGTTMDNTVDVTLDGEGTYNEFGYSVSGAGDVNNDGYADVIVGAYEYSLNGKAYVYGGAPDNVLPTMETIAEAQGQWYMTAPTFSNFGFDDETALDDGWYQMDGFGGVWTPLFTDASGTEWNSDGWAIPGFDALSEGSHTIYFKASDDAGNVGMWSWQFYKDTEPPSIPVLIYPPDSALLVDRTPTFIWHKSTDDVSGVAKYEIMYADNSTFSGPSKVVKYLTDTTYTPSSDITDDIVYWVVKAIDSIGNNSFWADKWHFTYDSEAPLPPTLVSLIGGIWLDDTLVTCEWTSVTLKGTKEPGTDVHYIFQLDDNPAFTSPFTDTTAATSYAIVLGEGIHYWRVRAYDLAGNQGNFSDTESFGIDVTLPSQPTPVAPPDSAIQNTPTIVFIWNSATDNPSGVDHYVLEYASNRVFWNAASVNVTDTVYVTGTLADSTYWWHVRAVDRAGNESPWSNRWYVTIDTQAPEVSALISPSDSSYINTITPTFVWGAATSTYCLQVGLDTTFDTLVVDTCGLADTFYTVTDSLLFDTLTYHWRVEAIDDAGNHSGYQEHPFMFTIDTIPPPIPTLLLPPDSSFTNDNTPTFVWSLVDSDTFITYCLQVATDTLFDSDSIVIDACNLTDTFYTVTDTLADSIYYWRAEAVDRAANHSGYQTPFMLTVDTQAPIFTLTTVWDDTSFTGPYPISSIITSALAGVDSAFIYYSFDAGTTWASIAMQLTPPDTYEVDIPQVPDSNTVVQYYLEASDLASNIGYDPAGAPDTSYSFVGGATTDEKLGTEEQVMIPTEFALHQNLPNPFSSVTSIQYSVVRPTHIALNIYDIAGNLVKILVNEEKKPGYYTVHWDGKDGQGQRVSPGIYFYRLEAHTGLGTGGFKNTKKLILLK